MKHHPNNLLTIDQFAQTLGLNPWIMGQFGKGLPAGIANTCGDCCLYETSWGKNMTKDGVSRAEVARAIHAAEAMFAKYTGYYPAPKLFTEDDYHFPPVIGRYEPVQPIKLNYGYLQTVGSPTLTALNTVAVTRASTDDDALLDTFTATVTVPTGTTADQVEVYFTDTDRDDLPLEDWQITPVRVSISGTTATIKGDAYLLAKPRHMRTLPYPTLDATDTGAYVSEVEVYRRTLDTCQQGTLIWNEGDCASTPCQPTTKTACFQIKDRRRAEIMATPVTTCTDGVFTTEPLYRDNLPDRVTLNYTAGYPLRNGLMDEWHAQIISWLAAALLPCETCACGCVRDMLKTYRNPPTYDAGDDQIRLLMPIEMLAKMGGVLRYGAVLAFTQMSELRNR